ncbi:F0F1 ATP synthase subunit epsilon [Gammaproteobacteria bacterium]|jgi:F-type H+-transporting ATPase subunit epsilon|nr:F0F1 ATP synthase subunit epsilon [Gammaproteobacteria bacterium]MDB4059350.1 F0F1 ATP synthase subunit epsilon [Gammaproteobacteria bacterium]|tara:strand:- start:1026 stop:1439 length:414 start_codon:yes stop_codon:yes gene_type:complete
MSTIKISIVSSSEEIYSGEATMVFATGSLGELGIAPGHTPLLTGLAPGPVRVQNGSNEETFFCSGGFVEVQPNMVTILSDTAERADSLDESEAIKAKESAEQDLADQQSSIDYTKAAAQLAEAVARLKTIQKLRKNI